MEPKEEKRGNLIFVKLERSHNHQTKKIQQSLLALGLRKINQLEVHRDTPTIRGLIYQSRHLLHVKVVSTAVLFPNGTDHLNYEHKTRKEIINEKKLKQKEINLRNVNKEIEWLDTVDLSKIPRYRKTPSKNNVKFVPRTKRRF